MKKFTKICLIISLILVLIGGTICVIGSRSGGFKMVQGMEKNGRSWRVIDGIGDRYWDDDWDDAEDEWDDIEKTDDRKVLSESEEIKDLGKVKDLEINIGGAALYVYESEDGTFRYETNGRGDYECYESGGVLYVEGDIDHLISTGTEKVYVYIPKDITLRDVHINVGAGLVQIDAIHAQEVDIEVGAGRVAVENAQIKELNLDVGMGECYVKGSVTEDIEVECGMGRAALVLNGKEEDYNYGVSCAAGSITIGEKSYSALANDTYIDNHASNECSLECAMGSIEISYK